MDTRNYVVVLMIVSITISCKKTQTPSSASAPKPAQSSDNSTPSETVSTDTCKTSSKLKLADDDEEDTSGDEEENTDEKSDSKDSDSKSDDCATSSDSKTGNTTTTTTKLDYTHLHNPPELAECNKEGKIYNFGYNVDGYAKKDQKCLTGSVWNKDICSSTESLVKAFGNSGSALNTKISSELKDYKLTIQCGTLDGKSFATFTQETVVDDMPALKFQTVIQK